MVFKETAVRMPDEDPFRQTEESSYDINTFYTAARETRGFSASKRVNIPPSVAAAVSQAVYSNKLPELRTEADFMRDAIVHNLYRCARIMRERGGGDFLDAAAEELRIESLITQMKNRGETVHKMIQEARDSINSSHNRDERRKEIINEFSMWPDIEERLQLLREFQ